MNQQQQMLELLEGMVRKTSVKTTIDSIASRVELNLTREQKAPLAWEPVPLGIYDDKLPDMIHSSWVFVLRARTNTGAERHPNSHQFMMSCRGSGDLQVWIDERWRSNFLLSDPKAPLENRWISIPLNIWHRAIVPEENWIVVSFHTAKAVELIEERPDAVDAKIFHQRRYLDRKE